MCPSFSTIDNQEVIYPLFSFIQFFKQRVSMALGKKIVLGGDACSRPPITIKSNDLHASDIRRDVGEIASYQEKD
jgi:hypothetical protein